jgi:hypothetical protein
MFLSFLFALHADQRQHLLHLDSQNLFVYVYVFVCVCVHTHTHARTHARTHAHTHRDRQTQRQTDTKTDRQTDRARERHAQKNLFTVVNVNVDEVLESFRGLLRWQHLIIIKKCVLFLFSFNFISNQASSALAISNSFVCK